MIVSDVMDEVATLLGTISGLRVTAWPPDEIQVPAAVVGYPEIDFDGTYARGMDRFELPVFVAVGKVSTRAARNKVTPYMDGSGDLSVKAALETGPYTAFHTLHVTRIAPAEPLTVGAVEYLSIEFTCIITGSGD